jgi:hypothetical protein
MMRIKDLLIMFRQTWTIYLIEIGYGRVMGVVELCHSSRFIIINTRRLKTVLRWESCSRNIILSSSIRGVLVNTRS